MPWGSVAPPGVEAIPERKGRASGEVIVMVSKSRVEEVGDTVDHFGQIFRVWDTYSGGCILKNGSSLVHTLNPSKKSLQ